MTPQKTLLTLAAVALSLRAPAFAVAVPEGSAGYNATDSYLSRAGVAYTATEPAPAGRTKPGATLRDAPGEDVEPGGFHIYESVAELPPYEVTVIDAEHERCYVRKRPVCVKGSFCGYVCEQVG